MRKHIFKTSNIFCIKKSVQNMLGYWPYATHKNFFFFFRNMNNMITQTSQKKKNIHLFQNPQEA